MTSPLKKLALIQQIALPINNSVAAEHQQVGRRVRTPNEDTILEYEPVRTREQTSSTSQRDPMANPNVSIPQYEPMQSQPHPSTYSQPHPSTYSHPTPTATEQPHTNVPLYQAIQPIPENYNTLSTLTRLPPKTATGATSLAHQPTRQAGARQGDHTSEYQALQGVSPQYQSLGALSRC